MYDYYLGGKDNYAVDQEAAEKMIAAVPESVAMVRANREFLVQAVRRMAEAGIRQFLDIGSGLPTRQNVHEVAQAVAPECRVVYVDHDALAVVHGQALLATNPNTAYVAGDLRRPAEILADPQVRELIDFDEPVGVLIVAILHFINDADGPENLVWTLRQVLAPGSHLAISHVLTDPRTEAIGDILSASGAPRWTPRTPEQVLAFFDGFRLLDPGLVLLNEWIPNPAPDLRWQVGGIGRLEK